jgi:leader peptidase (prepilin peptidase)/N-methyltransferase
MTQWIILLIIFLFGSCLGSFLNVCIYRVPLNLSIVFPNSFCPACQSPIRPYDNIPLFSFFFLKGKCRNCGVKISWRYPLVEALMGAITLALFLRLGLSPLFFSLLAFSAALLVITFIDLDHRIIPDVISLPGIVVGVILALAGISISIKSSLMGLLLGGGSLFAVAYIYEAITKREGMGGGDVKLLAMIGAWLGWQAVLFTLFFASLLGTIIGGTVMLIQKEGRYYAIPFGPFLALAALAYIFFGPPLIHWYLNFGKL